MQLPIYNELKEENNRLRLENNHLKNKFGINLSIEEKDNQNKNILLDSIFEDNKRPTSLNTSNSKASFSAVDKELSGNWGDIVTSSAPRDLISGSDRCKARSSRLQKGHQIPR